ncbi:hypothetical protein CBR_g28698 [Chara braunii]|uniref:Uncharacterized protein n=1 Tax=Chara braunii TaxID=69332 RepID=A0A388L9J8_CHABU|nr:hypothetical protein CBR_g28698 [Chara braunii]|eukprot:GBG78985.1 hypothetical protein CBR_g28698 [Chara braunii]
MEGQSSTSELYGDLSASMYDTDEVRAGDGQRHERMRRTGYSSMTWPIMAGHGSMTHRLDQADRDGLHNTTFAAMGTQASSCVDGRGGLMGREKYMETAQRTTNNNERPTHVSYQSWGGASAINVGVWGVAGQYEDMAPTQRMSVISLLQAGHAHRPTAGGQTTVCDRASRYQHVSVGGPGVVWHYAVPSVAYPGGVSAQQSPTRHQEPRQRTMLDDEQGTWVASVIQEYVFPMGRTEGRQAGSANAMRDMVMVGECLSDMAGVASDGEGEGLAAGLDGKNFDGGDGDEGPVADSSMNPRGGGHGWSTIGEDCRKKWTEFQKKVREVRDAYIGSDKPGYYGITTEERKTLGIPLMFEKLLWDVMEWYQKKASFNCDNTMPSEELRGTGLSGSAGEAGSEGGGTKPTESAAKQGGPQLEKVWEVSHRPQSSESAWLR